MQIIRYSEIKEDFYRSDSGIFDVAMSIRKIIQDVKRNGDRALRKYTLRFDRVSIKEIKIRANEVRNAYSAIDQRIIFALMVASKNLRKFAKRQLRQFKIFEYQVVPGVNAGQKIIPIERIGIYVPGGRFPLVSSLVMCAIPAQVVGVNEIAVCSPPTHQGTIHPAILVAADQLGIDEIYKVGGAQAIAALAYGTETIKKVNKIVGPGSRYVTAAKKEVFGAVGIDLLAGPTEIMIIADKTANPSIVAADLIAQAEHDLDAVPIFITDSTVLAGKVKKEIMRQLKAFKANNIAERSLKKSGRIIIVKNKREALDIANKRAPEHLELQVKNLDHYLKYLKNYGTLFIGENSAEALGDYTSGINHTLPTNSSARYTGGLSVKDFIKLQTTLSVTRRGLKLIGPAAKILSEVEGLAGHANSVKMRLLRHS